MKNIGCIGCHQLGQLSTRTIPSSLGEFKSGEEAWMRRVQSGQSGEQMTNQLAGRFAGAPFKYYGDWTDRIAKGELPHAKPTRPQGLERNIVVTTWDWGEPKRYLHDLIASDRRQPTVNANGPVFGSPEYSTDNYPILDPKTHKVTFFKAPVRDAEMPESLGPGHAASIKPLQASPYWGDEKLWDTRANNHNGMLDKKGRVWFAANVRGMNNPDFCKKGSDHPSAKAFPLDRSSRQVTMLDPKTMKYTFVDTCFGTHHPQFGYDADETLWLSGTGQVAGWVNTKVLDETGDAAKAQGWSPFILDTNGNGKRDDYAEHDQPIDPAKDKRIAPASGPYAVMPSPVDGSIWYTIGVFTGTPGFLRFDPKTQLTEVYNVPPPAFGIRGGDIDKNGVLWGSASSGHLVSFDRRKCKGPLNGPKATGDHCPEGWSHYQYPGPGFQGLGENSAEFELLHLGRPAQHVRAGRERPDVDRQPQRRAGGAQGRQDGPAARAVSDGLLRQGIRRAHRRSERRLEGPRLVDQQRRPHALAQGRRQGQPAAGGALPDPSRSAGALTPEIFSGERPRGVRRTASDKPERFPRRKPLRTPFFARRKTT